MSSAMCWLDRYHVDGLRVDAVASMLYLDYSRQQGEWIPNRYGGRENLEAIDFLRQLNEAVVRRVPRHRHVRRGVDGVAEVVTADLPRRARLRRTSGTWGGCTTRCSTSRRDPMHRKCHHDEITFRSVYMGSENYVLPLCHDEVVHGKGSLLAKMPGDDWQQFANLRLLFAMQWAQPGKKLLFMGGELATWSEWAHEGTLDWALHDAADARRRPQRWSPTSTRCTQREPALHRGDSRRRRACVGSRPHDADHSVFAWLRVDPTATARPVLVVINATPTPQSQLPARRAGPGPVGRAAQHRRRRVRRQRRGQLRRRADRAARLARPPPVDRADAAAARCGGAGARRRLTAAGRWFRRLDRSAVLVVVDELGRGFRPLDDSSSARSHRCGRPASQRGTR